MTHAMDPMDAEVRSAARPDREVFYALALGTFAVGTEGFMIAAVLPTIARDLAVSIEATGLLVTVFSVVYALSSPVLTVLTGSMSRRSLLLISLTGFVLANLVAALAPGYWFLVGARILLALTAGLYVPNANALAGTLAPQDYRGRALAIVNSGITVAVAVGVPLGGLVGAHLGWRMTFVGVAGLSVVALAVLALCLPKVAPLPQAGAPGLKERIAVVRGAKIRPTLLATMFWAMAAYTVYTYIAPFLAAGAGLDANHTAWMLGLLGCAAIAGVTLGGHANDRYGARRVHAWVLPASGLVFAGLTLAALWLAPHALLLFVPLVVAWGVCGWSFYPPQQARLVALAGAQHTSVVLSLNASFMYLGFALGAALGSVVIALTSVVWIGAAAAVCTLCAVLMSRYAWSTTP